MKKGFTNTPVILTLKGEGSRSGFTLMELLVYMMIVGIIVLVAGQAFTDSTKFRVRTQNMLRATQEAENVATLFKSDVSQMGAKSSKEAGNADGGEKYGDKFSNVYSDVFIDPDNAVDDNKDSSSFLIANEDGFSNLIVRRVRYDNLGHYQAVDEINWFVDNGVLKRSCRTVTGTADDEACKKETADEAKNHGVEIATGVKKFNIIASKPSVATDSVRIFPCPSDPPCADDAEKTQFRLVARTGESGFASGMDPVNEDGDATKGGKQAVMPRFYPNFNKETEALKDESEQKVNQVIAIKKEDGALINWKNMCSNYGGLMTFEKNHEYEIFFEIPVPANSKDKSLMFVPGKDHMSVGFRSVSTGDLPKKEGTPLIEDFLFFPPLDPDKGAGKRVMRFSVPEKVENVCLAFTFACYSPLVDEGSLTIENLKVREVANSSFDFEEPHFSPEAHKKEKKNVKGFKLELEIARGGKGGENGETGSIDLVIPTPSNGPRD